MAVKTVVDLGGYNIKIGFVDDSQPKLFDNCIYKTKNLRNRVLISNEIEECDNLSGLYFMCPFKKGYVNDWEQQKKIFDHVLMNFSSQTLNLKEMSFIVSEPLFNFYNARETLYELFFEEYQCGSAAFCNGPLLASYSFPKTTSPYYAVVDVGHSFTHIVCYKKGHTKPISVSRSTVGGKILTNRLVDILSYRQLDVRSEMYIVNQCKEDVCFVSQQFTKDLKRILCQLTKQEHTLMVEFPELLVGVLLNLMTKSKTNAPDLSLCYVLPDFVEAKRGYVMQAEAAAPKKIENTLKLCNERFTIPELLFHPSDIGFNEMGIAEALHHTIAKCPTRIQAALYANIYLIGGSSQFLGMKDRLQSDLRAMIFDDYPLSVTQPKRPNFTVWHGGKVFSKSADYEKYNVTRKEYEEHGPNICFSRYPTV